MVNLYFFLLILLAIIVGYLIGSISFSKIFAKLTKVNILTAGSKNAGATNLARLTKIRFGFLVAFADMGKVILAGYIYYIMLVYVTDAIVTSGIILNLDNSPIHNALRDFAYKLIYLIYLPPAVAVIAHCFPIYSKFKHGGKGVASFTGLCFFISPWLGLLLSIMWWIMQLLFKYVSISSIISTFLTSFFYWIKQLQNFYWIRFQVIPNYPFLSGPNVMLDWVFEAYVFLLLFFLSLLIIWMHRTNISRLYLMEEKKFDVFNGFKKIKIIANLNIPILLKKKKKN